MENYQILKGKVGQCPYCGSNQSRIYLEFKKTKTDCRFKLECKECKKIYFECHKGELHWTEGTP